MARKSILTEYEDISAFSGRPAEAKHHCIFGTGLRKLADEDGLYIPLTHAEHNMSPSGSVSQVHGNPAAEKLSKMVGQLGWEKHCIAETGCSESDARERFIKRYGMSFL